MRTYLKFIIAAALMLSANIDIMAQAIEDGEAFYIYRNDGDFNGFFYDEVEEMRYSKLDLDSIEHNEYVVQEVVTADSIYRIPLAAIDSVGFVQPDIILNPKLKNLDELGITPYVYYYDDLTGSLRIGESIPSDILPQVGDVLVSYIGGWRFNNNSIGRKVTEVSHSNGLYYVSTESLEKMSDIFVQFISVEEVGYDKDGNAKRRLAGYNSIAPRKEAAGGFTKTLVDVSLSPHLTFYPTNNSSISLDINLGVKLALGMVYRVRGDDFFIKASLAEDLSASAGATLNVTTSGEYEISVLPDGVTSLKFPAFCPLFEIKPLPKGFFRYEGKLYAKATLPEMSTSLRQSFTIDSDDPYLISFNFNERKKEPEQPSELVDTGDLNIGWNGFIQCGTKSNIGIFTNSWFSSIFTCYLGVDVYSGPKLEGNVNISAAALSNGDGAYSLKDCHFTFTPYSIDFEAKGKMSSLWGKDNVDRTLFDGNFSIAPMTLWMFPTFTGFDASISDDKKSISTTTFTDERRVFWKSQIGVGLYNQYEDKDNPILQYCNKKLYPGVAAPETYSLTFNVEKPGRYKAMPILSTLDYVIPIQSLAKEFSVSPYIEILNKEVEIPALGGSGSVQFRTNGNYIRDPGQNILTDNTYNFSLPINTTFYKNNYTFQIKADYIVYPGNGGSGTIIGETASDTFNVTQPAAPNLIYKYAELSAGNPINLGNSGFSYFGDDNYPHHHTCNISYSENSATISASGSSSREVTNGTQNWSFNYSFTINLSERKVTGGHGSYTVTQNTTDSQGYSYHSTNKLTFSGASGTSNGINSSGALEGCHFVFDSSSNNPDVSSRHEESYESVSFEQKLYNKPDGYKFYEE